MMSSLSSFSRRRSAQQPPSDGQLNVHDLLQHAQTQQADVGVDGGMATQNSFNRRRLMSSLQRDPTDFASFADDDELTMPVPMERNVQPEPDVNGDGPLSITTRIEYQAVPNGRSQDIFGLVTLNTDANAVVQGAEDKRQPLDIICVLDVSGSMSGNKIDLLKDAVRFIINESEATDRVGIVTFESQATRHLRLRRMDTMGKDEATRAVIMLNAGGGTRISTGLEYAVEMMERRRHKNSVSSIFLLTDGQDSHAVNFVPPLLDRARNAGCSVYTFGFGADHDSKLLGDMAEKANTPFTFVQDVECIREAFAGAMGGLSSVVAQDVKVTLQCDAQLKKVHTYFPMDTTTPGQVTIKIPDMLAGEKRDILVEMTTPADGASGESVTILRASAKYQSMVTGASTQTPSVEMTLTRTDEQEPAAEPDVEVSIQRQRVEVADVLAEASRLGDGGEFQEAQALLGRQHDRLSSSRVKSSATQFLMQEVEEVRSQMASRQNWNSDVRASVVNAMSMHRMQRSTNTYQTSTMRSAQDTKSMYAAPAVKSWSQKASPGNSMVQQPRAPLSAPSMAGPSQQAPSSSGPSTSAIPRIVESEADEEPEQAV
eukprot:CAMPEP_0206487378 /NCGR_PEP_ID=MMETSP0324_2-20121206/41605_1 /ASSEMBLY_ACC=CAM_ASM_000836 /TAXON_ID=2866 /ORGANISM="Crypthecodinium cohnii, Strain Seligo" /LENGTH=598 /DNA_ID=CAMNT_0053965847 /DNA_START=207 /DNA_END=2003 /DNA_ORIENTATION=+